MTTETIQLSPHDNMTVEQTIGYLHRNSYEYRDVIAVGHDEEGKLLIRSSHMSNAEAVFLLLDALDWARGITRGDEL